MKIKILFIGFIIITIFIGSFYFANAQYSFWKLVSSKLEPIISSWGIRVRGDFHFDDEIKPDGDLCSNGQILKKTGADDWDCAADSASANSIDFTEIVDAATLDANWSVASAGFNTTWNSDFFIGNNASVSGNFEVGGTASISALIINSSINANGLIDWDDISNSMTLDADTSVASGSFSLDWGSTKLFGPQDLNQFTASSQYVSKHYIDNAVSGIGFEFFLTNTASGSVYMLHDADTGEAESSIASSSLGQGDDQLLFTFHSSQSLPFDTLVEGIYSVHLHAERTGGNRSTILYWTLSKRASDSAETVLMTSETNGPVTSKAIFNPHATLIEEVRLVSTDKLALKIYGNLGTGAPTEITIYMEGAVDSRLDIKTTTGAFGATYWKLDGTNTPTGNWNMSGFNFTNVGLLTSTNASVSTNFEVGGYASISNTLFVDTGTDGRVGIGTTSPKHLLDVGGMEGIGAPGNLGIKSNSGAWAIRIEENSGVEGWHIGVDVDGDLNFDDSNTGIRLTFQDETGHVGIGTTSPGRDLEIYDSSPALRIRDSGATANATTAFIEFGGTDATAWNRTGFVGDASSGNADIYLQAEVGDLHLGDSSGSTVMNLQGGNVGIGTTTPTTTLDVTGSASISSNFEVGTDLFIVKNTGKVGIGTNSPVTELHVKSTPFPRFRLQESFSNTSVDFLGTAAGSLEILADAGALQANTYISFSTDGYEAMRVDDTGNVGIGTDVPTTKLDIVGAASVSSNFEVDGTASIGGNLFTYGTNTFSGTASHTAAGEWNFDSNTLVVDSGTGFVGIGTTIPDRKLHIWTGDAGAITGETNSKLVIENSYHAFINILTPNTAWSGILFGDEDDNNIGAIYYNHPDDELSFLINNSQKMVIDSSGNVGIGTTSPSGLLHVNGIANDKGIHFTGVNARNDAILTIEGTGVTGGNATVDQGLLIDIDGHTGTQKLLHVKEAGNSKFVVQVDGKVGIGTISPANRLDVISLATNVAGIIVQGGTSVGTANAGAGQILIGRDAAYRGSIAYDWSGGELLIDNTWNSVNSDIRFRTRTAGTAIDALMIKGTGNVGIGTITPTTKLDIIGSASVSGNFEVSHIYPNANNTYDLGSETVRWRAIYVSSGSLHIGDTKISEEDGELVFEDSKGKKKLSEIGKKDGKIAELEARIDDLEARILALENMASGSPIVNDSESGSTNVLALIIGAIVGMFTVIFIAIKNALI